MSVDENEEDEGHTEIRQILDEVAEGFEDPTLLRLSEEDVALDMDGYSGSRRSRRTV